MNIDRLILARIPDIAAVYGGARGHTMSSKHQRYAWPALVEAGVKRVIDLRGMAPPPIRGYRKDKGLDTNKIMRILNGFYKRITTMETPIPVIPESVFRERKSNINELSKSAQ